MLNQKLYGENYAKLQPNDNIIANTETNSKRS